MAREANAPITRRSFMSNTDFEVAASLTNEMPEMQCAQWLHTPDSRQTDAGVGEDATIYFTAGRRTGSQAGTHARTPATDTLTRTSNSHYVLFCPKG